MTRRLIASGFAWALACGSAFGQVPTDASVVTPAAQSSVKLRAVFIDMPPGTVWVSLGFGFCVGAPYKKAWTKGREQEPVSMYAPSFKAGLEKAGYKVITPGEDNLFDAETGSADYQAAAVITNIKIDGCIATLPPFNSASPIRGDSSMTIDWQIYSPINKQVVAHVSTTGKAHLEKSVPGGEARLALDAFADNAAALAANADFRTAMAASKSLADGLQTPGQQSKILLSGSLKAGPRKIADAVGSVVTIMNGLGSGPGVLVSQDGYILTDAHVVGDDKQARVRWSDGFETQGEVVRVAKNRDVALIKTDSRDRTPLAIKRGRMMPGDRVYAIGSPKGKDFQSTVSSGVISADRVFDGLRYIQSDTVVSHGSSGGPLLDESGAVIGLTDLGVQNDGPAGLNLFTPIGDAMDFLALEQQ